MGSEEWNWDPWNYRQGLDVQNRAGGLAGFTVHATDGDIGHVDEATTGAGESFVVVDTGPWIFGHRVMLPAGTIERVDWDEGSVWVDRTRDQIKDSPRYDDDNSGGGSDLTYRDGLDSYYRDTYRDTTLEA